MNIFVSSLSSQSINLAASSVIVPSLSENKTRTMRVKTYIKTGEQSSGDLVFEVASNNVDSFWMKMFEGWGFSEETNLQEFIFMVNSIAKNRFSINTRRSELFCLKQKKN